MLWCPTGRSLPPGCCRRTGRVLHGNRVIAHSFGGRPEASAVGQRRRQLSVLPAVRSLPRSAGDARRFENVLTHIAALIPRVRVSETGMLSFPGKGSFAGYCGGSRDG